MRFILALKLLRSIDIRVFNTIGRILPLVSALGERSGPNKLELIWLCLSDPAVVCARSPVAPRRTVSSANALAAQKFAEEELALARWRLGTATNISGRRPAG